MARVHKPWWQVIVDCIFNGAIVIGLVVLSASLKFPILSNTLYAADNSYEFGTVRSGTNIRHTFVVTNLHPWSVTVLSIVGSCGCTTGNIGRDLPYRLAPMSSIRVDALLDTSSKKGEVKQLLIIGTDENRSMPLLNIHGHVVPN
jgi:hypothetical protein